MKESLATLLLVIFPLLPQYRRSLPVQKPSILRTYKRLCGKQRKSGSCISGIFEGFRNTPSKAGRVFRPATASGSSTL